MSLSRNKVQRWLRMFILPLVGLIILAVGNTVATPAPAATNQPSADITSKGCTIEKGIGKITLAIKLVNSSSQNNRFWVVTDFGAPATAVSYDLKPKQKKILEVSYAANEHNEHGVNIAVYLNSDRSNALDAVNFLPLDCSAPPVLKFPPISYANAHKLAVVKIKINYVVNITVFNINDGVVAYTETFPDENVNQAKTITLNLGQGQYQIEGFGIVQDFSETFKVTAPSPKAWITSRRYGHFKFKTQWTARNVAYWEDGTKKNGKWTYGKNRYVTKTGTDGTYRVNGPNVGNGRGKVSENRLRLTIQYMLGDEKFGKPFRKTLVFRER